MFSFKNIRKSFQEDFWKPKNLVLDDLSFSVTPGSIVGFLGANGAGKTTSMRILMDFSKPDSGEVVWDPLIGRNKKEIFSNLGYLPERPYFYPDLNGNDFVDYMGRLQGINSKEIKPMAQKLGDRFNIAHAFNRKIKGYSKGMLQRIGFVSVLLHNPKFVILDEPLSGLDPIGRKELKDAIVNLKSEGKTVFFSSHIVSDVEEICDEVIFIDNGKLLYQGKIESLLASSQQDLSEVIYIDLNNSLQTIQVGAKELDEKLNFLIKENFKIKKVVPVQKSLESILYETKIKEINP